MRRVEPTHKARCSDQNHATCAGLDKKLAVEFVGIANAKHGAVNSCIERTRCMLAQARFATATRRDTETVGSMVPVMPRTFGRMGYRVHFSYS